MDVGQSEIASRVAIRQAFVIQSHQMEDGGVEVVHVNSILDGSESEYVGGSKTETRFDPATRHPDGEPVVVVVASLLALGSRCASKFATPQNQGFIE